MARTRRAAAAWANYAFLPGRHQRQSGGRSRSVDAKACTCGVKVFMGASTGNMLVDNEQTLEGIFSSPRRFSMATHCEDTPTILANEQAAAAERWGEDDPLHRTSRISAPRRPVTSPVVHGRRPGEASTAPSLHVLHLTTAREMELFESRACWTNKQHHRGSVCASPVFQRGLITPPEGADIKCNPAIKTAADQQALLQAVREDRIDIIATDHAPHTVEEKARPYARAPAGLPLVQHALLSLFEHVNAGVLDITTVVEKVAHAPARLFQVVERGYLRRGLSRRSRDRRRSAGAAGRGTRGRCFACAALEVRVEPLRGHRPRSAGAWNVGERRAALQQREAAAGADGAGAAVAR